MDTDNAQTLMETREQIITQYINAYNNFDVDQMLTHLDEAIRFENVSGGVTNMTLTGLHAFKDQAEKACELFSRRKQTPRSFKHTREFTEVEIDYAGVLALDLPNGMRKGDELSLHGKTIFQFSGDRVISITDIS